MDDQVGAVYVNGEWMSASDAKVSVFDHGFLYGDGVFDSMFARAGYIFKLDAHLQRLARSMTAIGLELPLPLERLAEVVVEAVARSGLTEAYIKVIVTRGLTGKPLLDPRNNTPTVVVFAHPYLHISDPARQVQGLNAKIVSIRRVPTASLDPRIKSLNYLNLVLAKMEATAAGCDEALLMDEDGYVCEGPGYNVFCVKHKQLFAPKRGILEGITRETVLELSAHLGFESREIDIAPLDLYASDEVFLTSTAGGLMPVTRVDGRTIGDGRPGPVYKRLVAAFDDLVASGTHGTPILATGAAKGP